MRKLIISICLVITGLIVSSCNLDPVKNYTFTYAIQHNIESEKTGEEALNYFKEVVGSEETFSITASRYDAVNQALVRYQALLPKIDDDKVSGFLEKGEYIQLFLSLVGTKGNLEVLAYSTWVSDEDKIEI